MKIILVTDYFYPSSIGGTEKYVFLLAKQLEFAGYDVRILTLSTSKKKGSYLGLNIDYIKPNTDNSSLVIKCISPSDNLSEFNDYMDFNTPNIVHFHTFTPNFNHFHFGLASTKGCKTFFTSHIPGHICPRGDFRFFNNSNCNGKLNRLKCSACYSNFKSKNFIEGAGLFVYNYMSKYSISNLRRGLLHKIANSVNQFITVSDWQLEILKKNGIYKNVSVCKQGIQGEKYEEHSRNSFTSPIRLGFLGRACPEKGLHLLIDVISKLPQNLFTLTISTPSPNIEHNSYFEKLQLKAKDIPNLNWIIDLNGENIKSFFDSIDFLVVPSLCFETGPFVVNEAFMHQTPVLGSNLGGIKELVFENVNGHLFEPNINSIMDVILNLKKQNYIQYSFSARQSIQMFEEMKIIYEN
ncbi:glycosyltransferase [Nubsella zeaxanthinifaciens]|uniref:glycosyltransferase n=1 Tax=Nubsella zeaxanthinifaciens TaxID=392412 RepID=UPI003CFF4E23